MPCTRPLFARKKVAGGIQVLPRHYGDSAVSKYGGAFPIPCGQCMDCRVFKARQWATRIMHESSMHERSSFVTLTYSDAHVPLDGSLVLRDLSDFMRTLRDRVNYYRGTKIRFYGCGEYGELNLRPHYHACIFGFDFPERDKSRESLSSLCDDLWAKGRTHVGSLTPESAMYVAGYVTKKLTGPRAEEYANLSHEAARMSLKPGIGIPWLQKWLSDVYPSDSVIVNGREQRPPRAYDRYLEKHHPDLFEKIKKMRVSEQDDISWFLKAQLSSRNKNSVAKAKLYVRDF